MSTSVGTQRVADTIRPPDGRHRPRAPAPAPLGPHARAHPLAARRRFALHGYDGTTIRAVAADAGIDPSMVMRYYGSKDGLFAAAAEISLDLPDLTEVPRRQWARRMVRHFFDRWGGRPGEPTLGLLLRSAATNAHAAERLRTIAGTQIKSPKRLSAPGWTTPSAAPRCWPARWWASPSAATSCACPCSPEPEDLVPDIGRTIQRYMTAPLPAAGDHPGDGA